MSTLISIGHIVGAIIAQVALGFGLQMLGEWEIERNRKAALQELSIALGIPVSELDNVEHEAKVVKFAAARFDSELLRNRLSDLCGWIQTGWGWFGMLLQAGILLGVIWFTITEDPSISVYAWSIIAVVIFFCIVSVLFGLACKLLTGRYPGQAREARKILAEVIERRRPFTSNVMTRE